LKADLMSKKQEFAICLANEGFDDLEVWKVYRVLPDSKAGGVGCIRVIDESEEDYLYPADRFAVVYLPKYCPITFTEMAAKPGSQGVAGGHQK